MSTHRRAWMVRSGIVAVLAAAGLFGIASPALAAGDPKLSDISLSKNTIKPNEEVTVNFTVKMSDGQPGSADVSVTSNNGKVTCNGTCVFGAATIDAAGKKYQIQFKASGQFTQDEQVTFTIKAGGAQNTQNLTVQAAVQAPPTQNAPASVPDVSGVVKDIATGTGLAGAKVFVQDSSGLVFEATTDAKGNFKVSSTAERPIKAGVMSFTVEKEGIEDFPGATKNAIAGQPVTNVQLTVTVKSTANPNDSASAALPGDSGSQEINPIESDDSNTGGEDDGGSGLPTVLIIVGALLVALGVGAIVLLFVRKKKDDDDETEDEDPQQQLPRGPRPGGPPPGGPGPGGRGGPRPPQRRGGPGEMAPPTRAGAPGYDATRQMRPPVSPGGPGPRANNDQTMISPSPLANAPTQLHSRIPQEPVDPYAPPTRHNGGPAGYPPSQPPGPGPAGAYGAGAGYGQPPVHPAANPTSGYPGGAPTYGQGPDQYGQPYGQGPDAYGPPAGAGYGQGPDPYGQAPDPYGQAPDPYAQPGYGQQPDPYGQAPSHGGPAYDPRADPRADPRVDPRADPRADPRGPRPGPAHQPPTQPDPRRVDWLDD